MIELGGATVAAAAAAEYSVTEKMRDETKRTENRTPSIVSLSRRGAAHAHSAP